METRETLTGYAIVVVDRGFVYVGHVEVDDKWCVITGARNIRYWGTGNGLGELALKGPQTETKLDDCGTVRIPIHALIHLMETEEKLWKR
jgi:hypothetical protein